MKVKEEGVEAGNCESGLKRGGGVLFPIIEMAFILAQNVFFRTIDFLKVLVAFSKNPPFNM